MPEPALLPPEIDPHAEPASAPYVRSEATQPAATVASPAGGMFNTFERTQEKRSATSTAIAVGIHVVAILLIVLLVSTGVKLAAPAKTSLVTELTAPPPPPPPIHPIATRMGGGGGQKGPTPVTQGHLPKFDPKPLLPPKIAVDHPKLAVQPAINVQTDLHMANNNMPDIGVPNSSLKGFSMGNGNGSGLGSGNGNGLGPGSGGNTGGGVYSVGGSVLPPSVLHSVEPEFSEEARKAKFSGNVLVSLIVGSDGKPRNVRVLRGVGMGLDENAKAAVEQYRFRPATKDGKPVAVAMNMEVNFQIF